MKEVNVTQLKSMMDSNEDFQLIDVREPHENEIASLGGLLIPMAEVPHNIEKIARDKKVIIHCKAGGRSARIVQFLEAQYGFENLYNLEGGILAWADQIDSTVPKY
jgi:sulfur-carrier protein adenylyltransferase/sulfurtransferase